MAEIAVDEILDWCMEATEDMECMEAEEAVIGAIRKMISDYSEIIETLKSRVWPVLTACVKTVGNLAFGVLIAYQIGEILYKKFKSGDPDAGKKNDVIAALKAVIQTEMGLVQKLSDWLEEHKNDTITLDDMTVPLESLIEVQLEPVSKATDKIFAVAKSLTEKHDGKLIYNLPTTNDVINLIEGSEEYCKAVRVLITFVSDNVSKFKELSSFPIKMSDVETLTPQLNHVRELPLK